MLSETGPASRVEPDSLRLECSHSNELRGRAVSIIITILLLGLVGFYFWLAFRDSLILPQRLLCFFLGLLLLGIANVAGLRRWRETTRVFVITQRGIERVRDGGSDELYAWDDLECLRLRTAGSVPIFKFRGSPAFPLTFNLVAQPSKEEVGAVKERIIAWLGLEEYVRREAHLRVHLERRFRFVLASLFIIGGLFGKWLQHQHIPPVIDWWIGLGLLIPLMLLAAWFEMHMRRAYRSAFRNSLTTACGRTPRA